MTQTSIALALAVFSFMLTVIWGTPLVRVLRYFKVGKAIRVDGPERHFSKLGTPTMGGVMIILPVVLITVLLNASNLVGITLLGRSVMIPVGVMVSYAILGAVDDWQGLRGKRYAAGLSARTKFLFQVILALITATMLRFLLQVPDLYLPGVDYTVKLGIWYIPVAAFLIVTFSNAVNLTDGLDGLAGLISATAFAAYGGIALLRRNCTAAWMDIPGAVLFYGCGSDLWIFMVQRSPCSIIYGRHRLFGAWSHVRCRGVDDRTMGASAGDSNYPNQYGAISCSASILF